ncbi:S-adenosylmethionine:tRNA ribosyltransferase-isomerase [Peribacillus deserti]|uniref:S-adenosylmethionine:tRNA ribosyltransferase-isomerase n=1 Tax=Peribacillus deserti TaxID=673318 RepID=A0ABS2QDW3_9BACI|nr:S-adenosylmethionine:tRNA ribosyltransferase-isomerase [Peribacillus deserti]MBM7691357.1 S-adenosylmethionine:tRNA ribosyltransferase-isomerase [Peribacillus deserti]
MIPEQHINFHVPQELNASVPPERRGVKRDHVKMMVLDRKTGKNTHDQFYNLDQHLNPGDLIVLNNSRTIPAVLSASLKRSFLTVDPKVEIRLAHRKGDNIWDVLIVSEKAKTGDILYFSDYLQAVIMPIDINKPLQTIVFPQNGHELLNSIYKLGEPVRYEYIHTPWNLDYYQTVYASYPGSIEMPSAGRAFTWELLFKLQKKGIRIAYLQLHTGLSYFLDDKWTMNPSENQEEYEIPESTMQSFLQTKAEGGRVIAVGTTVVRALETAVFNQNLKGWTNLYIHSDYKLKAADGIITGLHEPEASHLDMLSAFVNPRCLIRSYKDAILKNYLWHEFGDMNLII